MRALVQRVQRAAVEVEGEAIASIGPGCLVLLGVGPDDGSAQTRYLSEKIAHLRIFEDEAGKTNLSLQDVRGEALVVSQFTLYADTRKGRRPSFIRAAGPAQAEPLVDQFVEMLAAAGVPTCKGAFGAHMQVSLVNDGPMTIWIDTD